MRGIMKLPRHRFLHLVAGAAALSFILLTLSDQSAWNQTTGTIRIVVPFPPGGSADILARLLGQQINKANGPTIVVENRPGGGASIAYEAVARAAARHQRQLARHQSTSAQGQLRSAHEFRAGLLSPQLTEFDRRQRLVALSHSERLRHRCASEARRTCVRNSWSRDHATHRVRAIQAPHRHQCDLCALPGWRTRYYGPARWACERGAGQLFGSRRAIECGYAARARFSFTRADCSATGCAVDDRGGLKGLRRRCLVRLAGTREDSEGRGRPACDLVQSRDAGARR